MNLHSNPEDMTVMELLGLINDISIGYDGYNDSNNLKGLIDEMASYARLAMKKLQSQEGD